MKDHFPKDAFVIKFKPLNSSTVKYRIWPTCDSWCWAALGHSGKEATQEAAMTAAREYILMGVNGLKSYGKYRGVFSQCELT